MIPKIDFPESIVSWLRLCADVDIFMLTRFFDDLERKRSVAMRARNISEEKALEEFRSARTKDSLLGIHWYRQASHICLTVLFSAFTNANSQKLKCDNFSAWFESQYSAALQAFSTISRRINLVSDLTCRYCCCLLFAYAEGDTVTEMQEESPYSSKMTLEQSNVFVIPSKRAEENTARPLITSKKWIPIPLC